jgi:ElaB/YqjD/DUF883 family membrane-anchored ribosome-binding protein
LAPASGCAITLTFGKKRKTIKEKISEINAELKKVHDVLTNLISSDMHIKGDEMFRAVEDAEELLENIRYQLTVLSRDSQDPNSISQ